MGAGLYLWATTEPAFTPEHLAAHPNARDIMLTYDDDGEAHARADELQRDGWRVRLLRVVAEYVP